MPVQCQKHRAAYTDMPNMHPFVEATTRAIGGGAGLGYAPDAPLLVHGTSGMIVAFGAALTAVLML